MAPLPAQLPRRADRGRREPRRCGLQLPACNAAQRRMRPLPASQRCPPWGARGEGSPSGGSSASGRGGPGPALLPQLGRAVYGTPTRNFLLLFSSRGCGEPPRPEAHVAVATVSPVNIPGAPGSGRSWPPMWRLSLSLLDAAAAAAAHVASALNVNSLFIKNIPRGRAG